MWPTKAQYQRESADHLAQRIEIANHVYQIKCGDNYRCQFCCKESKAVLWVDMNTCPLCGRKYDWMMAQDNEE